MKQRKWNLEEAIELYRAGHSYSEICKSINEKYELNVCNNTIAKAFDVSLLSGDLKELRMCHKENKNSNPIKLEGKAERTPKVLNNGDEYIISVGHNSVTITKDKLRELKEMYCLGKFTINQVCLELDFTRSEFNMIKTALGITKDDVPVLDEDLDDIDAIVELTIQNKKKMFNKKLRLKEIDTLRKENEKYKRKDYQLEVIHNYALEHMNNYTPKAIALKKNIDNGLMYELPIYDLHHGKMSWNQETGASYDYKIARARFEYVIQDQLSQLNGRKFERVLFPIGQDFFNFDTIDGKTTGGTPQNNDLRWQKLFTKGIELLIDAIETLKKLGKVEAFYSPGNHDTSTSFYATNVINAYFRNNDNVNIDLSPNVRKYKEFGNTLLGFTHLDKEKVRIFGNMQVEAPQAWARTLYREWHGGHLHSNHVKENFGVTVRNLSCITLNDAWHHTSGYVGAIAKTEGFVYDKEKGLRQILVTNVTKDIR